MAPISRRNLLQVAGGTVVGGGLAAALPASTAAADTIVPTTLTGADPEPSVETALNWWPPQRQVWTPLGWKGHLFRFNQFYSGTVVCEPGAVLAGPKPNVQPYQGKNFQVTVEMPTNAGTFRPLPTYDLAMYKDDLGMRRQQWLDQYETPVLMTEFRRQEGLVLKQYAFAHVKGGGPVETSIEPLYAWLRFEIDHVDERMAAQNFTFMLRLSKAFLKVVGMFDQQDGVPVVARPGEAPLEGPLRIDRIFNPEGRPLTVPVYDAAGNVRLIVGTPEHGTIGLTESAGHTNVFDLRLGLPVAVGNHVDVLVPLLPQPADEAKREWALGRDGALAECEAFWRPRPSSAVKIRTAETHVDEFFRRSTQLAEVVAERSPDSGLYTFLSGSYAYDVLWSTPTSMVSHMFLDLLGYHDVVEQHIEIYKASQGSRVPPSPLFEGKTYPGYLSTPASLQAIDWMTDHGAVLEVLSMHALLTNRRPFIDKWLDPIVKACEFVVEACAITGHDGVPGLMPPGVNTDELVVTQGINSQAWTYKGLRSAVKLLRRLGHPRAAEFDAFSNGFRTKYVAAMRDLAEKAPKWTDSAGRKQPVLPASFTGERGSFPELVMFDGGALMSVWSGLMPATDPLMRSYLDFFRTGPNIELFDAAHHNALDRVVLDHEQSSGEPCYSWNTFHSWQLGDRRRYLEGMYGLLVGGISAETFVSSEHRNAIYGNLFTQPLITWLIRHAVIDDEIADGDLHLLRMCPLAWLSDERPASFERMPTLYGTVSLGFKLSRDRRTLTVSFSGDWHHKPRRTVLHPPPLPGLKAVVVNGRKYDADQPITL